MAQVRFQRLGPADFKVMPWKNGQGCTTEILIEPPGATLGAGFLWRLSMAPLEHSGSFSVFPGVDRTLLLLEGTALELDHGSHGQCRLDRILVPAVFSGDWATQGRLPAGPCRDFNVMSLRSRLRHQVTVLRPGPQPLGLPAAPTLVVFCAQGRAALPALGVTLEPHDLLRLDDGSAANLGVQGLAPGTALVAVAFFPA